MNDEIETTATEALPDFATQPEVASPSPPEFWRLHPSHITVERIVGWITFLVVLSIAFFGWGIAAVATWSFGIWHMLSLVAIAVVFFAVAWLVHSLPKLQYHRCKYKVDDEGLEIHRGLFWRTIINVPISRVQHTDVRQGPLQRRYLLGTLIVYTAGTEHSSVQLEGISFDEAKRLRSLLVTSGQDHDAV